MNRNLLKWICSVVFVLVWFLPVQATHIAGAELTYECLGNDQYRFKLKLYRDCLNGQAPFDDPLTLFIFRDNGTLHSTQSVNVPFSTPQIIPENWDACVGIPYNLCIEEAIYETTISLPAIAGGYNVAWARCCRNNIITNLQNPQCEGVTFLAHVPGPSEAICNSMPEFNQTPSLFLCAGETFYFDYSATDQDGDSLVYEISDPYTGLDFNGNGAGNSSGNCGNQPNPAVDPFNNPMGPPPYAHVVFANGHSATNPFGPGGSLSINPSTGYLEAFPPNLGVFVLAVSVKEYRNGVLLSENKRDFQFYVINCQPQGDPPVLTHDLSGLNTIGDTIFAQAGRPFCYDFVVADPQPPSGIVVTPLSVSFGGNGGFPPPYATLSVNGTSPPVSGQICWRPPCEYVGQSIPMIISARDTNDCPNYNIVFDTIWVQVQPSPGGPPLIAQDLSQAAVTNGDTIILDVQDNFCYNFMIVDTIGDGSLTYENILMDTSGMVLNQVQSVTTSTNGDTLFGEVCWQSYCNYGATYMFVTNGIDEYQCPPDNISSDTVWIRITTPFNPAPVVSSDISQNSTNVDTIIAPVHEGFCFDFLVVDTSLLAGDSLLFDFRIEDLNGNQAGGALPNYFATFNNDTITGQVCWTPHCINNEALFRFIVIGIQQNECQISNSDYDTIYVRVVEPYRPPPILTHNLGASFPDNYNINLEDDEGFCFDFTLLDTVSPSHVDLSTEVFLANGDSFGLSSPDVVIILQNDSLIMGEICWTVPCELADQSFKIRLIGKDTFDCNTQSIVYDSVLVHHVELPPDPVSLCGVSVLPGDSGISVHWTPNIESDGVAYIIHRRLRSGGALVALDTLWNYGDSLFLDRLAEVDAYSYCYGVTALDRCGKVSNLQGEACSILLSSERDDYTANLEWNRYEGWASGVLAYDVYRNYPFALGSENLIVTVNSLTYSYTDRNADQAQMCYRIRSASGLGECLGESWSNESCVEFPATVYIPNAFSPNGDSRNDFFSSFGEFEASFHMEIYDRWGKLLFVTEDKSNGWNGTLNGQPQPEGVYIYKIVVTGFDGEVINVQGSVTLIR